MSDLGFQLKRLQEEIEAKVQEYNNNDKRTQQLQQNRSSLLEQEHENSSVLKEIDLLNQDAKIYKQVGGVLIDQAKKEVRSTLSSRIGLITSQIMQTSQLITAQEGEQKALAQKIQKAKEAYYMMAQKLQVNQ